MDITFLGDLWDMWICRGSMVGEQIVLMGAAT